MQRKSAFPSMRRTGCAGSWDLSRFASTSAETRSEALEGNVLFCFPRTCQTNKEKDGDGRGADIPPGRGETAEDVSDRKKAARRLRQKVEEKKLKATHAAVIQGPTIADLADADLDDPAAWVAHMRKQEREKKVLASQGRLDAAHYDDSDDEDLPRTSQKKHGSGDFLSGRDVSSKRRRTDVSGLVSGGEDPVADKSGGDVKVVHNLKDFEEGEEVVLTLKDTSILTEEGDLNDDIDTLESVHLAEMQRLRVKLKNKQKKAVYDPTEDWEEGEDGPKKKEILQHYDDWEQENLAARGKASLPGEAKGFILPNLQGAELDEPAEVQVALLMERQKTLQRAKQGLMRSSYVTVPGPYFDETRDLVTADGRIKYDASGPTAAIPGEEMTAKQEEKSVTFRKLRKKKVSKKKQGAAFWRELLSGGAPEEEGEARDDESDAIQPALQSARKADRHHGSRSGRQESKKVDVQKEHVRQALDAAATSSTAHTSPAPPAPQSLSSPEARKEHQARAEETDCPDSGLGIEKGKSGRGLSGAEAQEESVSDDDSAYVGSVDRELQETLQKQRRLANLKLKKREQVGEDEGKGEVTEKTVQAKLLDLLDRAKNHCAVVDDDLLPDPLPVLPSSSGGDRDSSTRGAAPAARRIPLPEEEEGSGLQLTTTTEFCRSIQTPLEKIQTMKQEVFTGSRLFRQQQASQTKSSSSAEGRGKKEGDGAVEEKSVEDKEGTSSDEDETEDVGFMNESPIGLGVAEALKYLQSKSHFSLDKMRQRRRRPDELPLHKPLGEKEIKLDHRDQYGNVMTPKDAFRQISWRFHGKYPSLRKQEKKMKKMDIERKLLCNPMEALPTLNALQKLQETEKASHLVLTGGSLDH
ncbi:sart-1 family protein [Cystoisospora suis]|uniref:Sart-1 family protein n=1 Tax=Cystoisospora suis TaxID=483139 RepID=A0A2C6LCG7_9APIC|nr:sart-1 family protein [Cystoisospora suis]